MKFLFTSENLSVQVHPQDSAGGPGKTEMWYVLRADPGARLALGFDRRLTPDRVRAAALSGEIEALLRWYAPRPGDTFFVPAGTVHAIGAGLALCEIQQHSDVTFRLYDYGRPRGLHLEEALAVADFGCHPGPASPVELGDGRRLLIECPYFRTESIEVTGELIYSSGPGPELLVCLEGDLQFAGESCAPGQIWVAPAGARAFSIQPRNSARFLRTFVP